MADKESKNPEVAPAEPASPAAPTAQPGDQPKVSKNIPKVDVNTAPLVPVVGATPEDTAYKGRYTKHDDGEPYALAIDKEATDGRTHFAKNSAHFWNGTEAEFRAQFEKE